MTDIFQRIWLGKSEELCIKIPDNKVNCIITDPPFGVDNQSNMAVTKAGKEYARKIENDENPEVAIKIFKEVMAVLSSKMTVKSEIMIFTSFQVLGEWLVMCDSFLGILGYKRKAIVIWKKDGPGMGDLTYQYGMGSEFILCYRRGSDYELRIPRRNNVLYYPQVRPRDLIHPHEKPQALLCDLIKGSTDVGDFLVDPFGGSASLARAARTMNRSALCIEKDEYNYKLSKEAFARTSEGIFD